VRHCDKLSAIRQTKKNENSPIGGQFQAFLLEDARQSASLASRRESI
jgi:hypothetical protein